jgi:hypothetical protein
MWQGLSLNKTFHKKTPANMQAQGFKQYFKRGIK